MEQCLKERAEGRKVLEFVRQTGKHNMRPHVSEILCVHGLQVGALFPPVSPRRRVVWSAKYARDLDVLIRTSRLVKVSLNLRMFATAVFIETEWSLAAVAGHSAGVPAWTADAGASVLPCVRRNPGDQAIGPLLVRYQESGILRPEHLIYSVVALLGPLGYFAMARGTAFEEQIPPIDLEAHVRRFLDGRRVSSRNVES